MRNVFIFLIATLLCSCQKTKENERVFFDFDQIEHYHIDFTAKQFKPIQNVKSNEEKLFYNILRFDYPKSINEQNFIENLEKFYKKKLIDSQKFNLISEIYSEKEHADPVYASCAPFYRDVLVFKKYGKVIGISKICFECNYFQCYKT